jgi:hypothetical protein
VFFGKGGFLDHRSRTERRGKSGPEEQPTEDAIKEIQRATLRHFPDEEKSRIVSEGLGARRA